ncbi:hypothetical protein IID22_01990 [Patescibacteria group bacterium]|nr:hypothetical protein [Patescibacteria group bacterium]
MTKAERKGKEVQIEEEALDLAEGLRNNWKTDDGLMLINLLSQSAGLSMRDKGGETVEVKLLQVTAKYLTDRKNLNDRLLGSHILEIIDKASE